MLRINILWLATLTFVSLKLNAMNNVEKMMMLVYLYQQFTVSIVANDHVKYLTVCYGKFCSASRVYDRNKSFHIAVTLLLST